MTPADPMSIKRPILGVSACLLRGAEVLLVKRGKAPFAGLLSLPGGRVEFGEHLLEAARREIAEETGLRPDALHFHCLHEAIDTHVHVVIAVHRGCVPDGAEAVAGDDAATLRYVAVADLQRLEDEGCTTPGLAAIVRSVAEAGL